MIRRNTLFATLLAPALLLAATPAMAQVCFGIPMSAGQTAVGLNAAFPESANAFGIDGRHKLSDQLLVGAGYTLFSYTGEAEDVPSQHNVSVLGAYEFVVQGGEAGPQIGICPNVAPEYAKWDDNSAIIVPLGIGAGTAFAIGQTAVVAPYVNPALVLSKADFGDEFESDWENDFGFTLGANLVVTNLHFGASYEKIGDGDGVFGVRAGIVF